MKYDLLFSDIVALVAGLFGFLATLILLEKAILQAMHGDPSSGMNMGMLGFVVFLLARCFLMPKPYDRMLKIAVRWWARLPFFLITVIWLFCVMLALASTSEHDLFGVANLVPWIFKPEAMGVIAFLLCLAFVFPGFAFRPYRSGPTQPVDVQTSAHHTMQYNPAASVAPNTAVASMHGQAARAPARPVKLQISMWAKVPFYIWMTLCFSPILARMLGQNFLPAEDWLTSVKVSASLAGGVTAFALLYLSFLSLRDNPNSKGFISKAFSALIVPVLGWFLGVSAITTGVPMAHAIALGSQTKMPFVVTKFTSSNSRKCENPITLEGMPLLFGRLCGFPEELGETLRYGDEIMVFGRGTPKGIFAKQAGRLKPGITTNHENTRDYALRLVMKPDHEPYLKLLVNAQTFSETRTPAQVAEEACRDLGSRYQGIDPDVFEGLDVTAPTKVAIIVGTKNKTKLGFKVTATSNFSAEMDGNECLADTIAAGVPLDVLVKR